MQLIIITGRIGGDAETRKAGKSEVTNFNCAVDQGFGDTKKTIWYRVSIWGERGVKLAPFITKGNKINLSGDLTIGEFQGKPQYEIRAGTVDPFMQSKTDREQSSTSQREAQPRSAPDGAPLDDDIGDDVPF